MKGYDVYALAHLVPIAVLTAGAGASVLPLTPWAGWAMLALSALSTAMTIEVLLGWPLINAWCDRSWRRREGHGG